ncbi:uncharacterized protein BDZ99DRAFT_376991 [Mytilinidion resinicola]|uniref:Transcription initiation factor TFIID subunit 4 n=1 Tax=Mytilinidion resinicola TaxID=574789 RepID=A0A6A6Z3H0_9PEZI|nr:uncharacterized protein BDZ99DRAFT_376991 [Mytilinidion resinicola]KAF2815702.1 hypothetical protein BDZ99DRAFT_376991 [Mytilinidion resinicola]
MHHPVQPPQHYPPLPPLQPPQRTYSPYQGLQSPPGGMSPPSGAPGAAGPPNKRARLSPTPSPYSNSPYATSPYATSPTGQYLSPHLSPHGPPPPSVQPPMPHFHQPQPFYHQQPNDNASRAPATGSMGPPKVPYSKTTDSSGLDKMERSTNINDLSDIITAAGIDEREEEDYLSRNYRNQHSTSFVGSFNSQSSSTVSPNGSFQWPQGQHGAFQGAGPLSQPPVTEKTFEEKLEEAHRSAARALNEAQQYHLNDPFLVASAVRHKLHNGGYEHGVEVDLNGLYDRLPQTATNVQQRVATGADGSSIAVRQADSVLSKNAPLVDILTLISLAAQERIRTVIDDAYGLARGRQVGSNGLVPPEWADIATGVNAEPATAVPTNLTKSAWEAPDSAVSPMTVPGLKPSSAGGLPSPPTESPPSPKATVQIPNNLASTLKKLAARDRRYEQERLERRAKRQKVSLTPAGASPTVPGTPSGDVMAEMKPLSKKERDRLSKIDQSQDVLHRNANATASLALGGGKKKYSWMTGGAKPATPSRINTGVGAGSTSGGSGGTGPVVDRLLVARDRKFGSFREDETKGRGIQLRDIIHVLDYDGKERKTLMRTLARLKSNEV